jgi:hypothetical protein
MSFDPQKLIREQQQDQRSQSWWLTKIHDFNQAHNRLKHTVHTTWRYPLPPWGRFAMGCFYFSMPVVAGYYVSIWAVSKSEATIEERFGHGGTFITKEFCSKRVRYLKTIDSNLPFWFLPPIWFLSEIVGTIQGLGDKKIVRDESGERMEKVGAGGWGGGVHLANSDTATQDVNRINLERFMRKQRRLIKKREREARKKEEGSAWPDRLMLPSAEIMCQKRATSGELWDWSGRFWAKHLPRAMQMDNGPSLDLFSWTILGCAP